ncbi:thioredoxin domain-containing protein [Flavobacterium agrisoli]|uniref:Thioredoxin fold domain-containing protein n=1 Tax=Flavobacterium agrisoli TaxID=2793066 RepID=A0A934PMB7_9FLAO|nr:thioredoxin domain-containing protein [Flavobacterium agrisoli]MBK0370826.1 thioredoxin fold domain-containing protein [Flavobacterium agrisoli]
MKITKILLLITAFIFASCNGQSEKTVEVLPSKTFSEKINTTPNVQLLDVRTPEEFSSEHLDKAVNINWKDSDFETQVAKYDKEKPVFVYCLSGGRSKKAAEKLNELGFTSVYELEGGITKWNADGFGKPLDKVIGMTKTEYKKLIKSDKKVLVDFYAEWCAPCQKMKSYITKMEQDSTSDVVVIRIDADKNKTLASEMKINQLPTLILYNPNQEEQWRYFGYISEENLRKQL